MIVVDTTVLSNLARANRMDLLEELHVQIAIPSQVHEEVLRGIAAGYGFLEEADKTVETDWARLVMLEGERELTLFRNLLEVVGYGEAAGIAIAKERNLVFFSDDRKARRVAREQGVAVSGTLGMLKVLVEERRFSMEEVDVVLSKMIQGGYRSPIQSLKELLTQ